MVKGGETVTAIINAKAVLDSGIVEGAVILVDNGRIVSADGTEIPKGADIIDAEGLFVGPGFVDIHVHGGGGNMFYAEPVLAAEHFLAHGETTVLATLYYDLSADELIDSVKRIRSAMKEDGAGKAIKGIYMEGPYMNPKYGASPEKNKWRGEIKEESYRTLVDEAREVARVWAIAPEREGIEGFLEYVKKVSPDVMISVGHSEATPKQVKALKKYGIGLQTHCMNATGRPPCPLGTRSCGPDEACLMDKEMYAEIICDSAGIHLSSEMIEFVLAVKGSDRVVLISDSFVGEPSPKGMEHITDLSFDANGNLSGSKLTLDVACRNLIKHTGCSIETAFRVASRNSARVIGLDGEIGSIEAGKKADLVFVDSEFNVKKVILEGKLQKGSIC